MKIKIIIPLLVVLFSNCLDILDRVTSRDLDEIKRSGELKALTKYGANSYFIYKGTPMGLEYDLLKNLAKELGVALKLTVTKDADNLIYMINTNKADLIAANIAKTKSRTKEVMFTEAMLTTRQVLVQRQNPTIKQDLIRNPLNLIGKTIHVRKGSHYFRRLKNLSEEIGGEINIKTVAGDVITEELIKMVASKKINYTIADENTALINKAYLPNLDVSTVISFPQRVAWALGWHSPKLKIFVNNWIKKIISNGFLKRTYNRYYRIPRVAVARLKSQYHSTTGKKISRYDALLKKHSKKIQWDWRLLASLAFQESRFTARAKSWAGARGLLQLMPQTAIGFGRGNLYNPKVNVTIGTNYIKYLHSQWKDKILDKSERLKFVIASYNAGPGHVIDARELARKYGRNPDIWLDNVDFFILNLSNPKYFNDPVVRHGYCRGDEPYLYVKEILERYNQYKEFIPLN